jgi:hypothetical protein
MKRAFAFIALAMAVMAFASCSTVTMLPKGTAKLSSEPTYESSKPFYIAGLVGEQIGKADCFAKHLP